MSIFIYLLSGLFLGWSFGAKDTGNIFGAAVETRMISFKQAALIASIFVTLGAIFDGGGPSQTLSKLGAVNALGGAFTVALAAAVTITLMVRIGIPVATSQTLAGAIIGWNFFAGRLTDYNSLAAIAGSWILAPLLGAVLAYLLFFVFRAYMTKVKLHLLEQDMWTRYGLLVVGAFGAYSLGANNIANIVGVFVPVNPFKDIQFPGLGTFSGVTQLFLLGSLSIVVGIYTYSHNIMKTVGKELFRMSPLMALIAVLAESIVLFLFSSKDLHSLLLKVGLPPIPLVPVSASQIIVGAVLGIGLAKGGKNLKTNILGRISIGWVIAPVLAFGFSYVALFIVQNVFEQKVKLQSEYVFNKDTLIHMKNNGINIDKLVTVNGRTYEKEMELYNILQKDAKLNRNDIFNIIRIAEINKLKIDESVAIKNRLSDQLTFEQYNDLLELQGKTYEHNWQLVNDLREFKAWQSKPQPANAADQEYNKQLVHKMDLLCQIFTIRK